MTRNVIIAALLIFISLSFPVFSEETKIDCKYSVIEKNGLFGFKDCKGKTIIDPVYEHVGDFHEGYCLVRYNRREKYIDRSGKFLNAPDFELSLYFSEGLAPVRLKGKWGYINSKGEIAIQPAYDDARTFRKGTALVSNTTKNGIMWGLIDKTGKALVDVKYDLKTIHKIISEKYR